jgi:hypothetical protein
MSHCDTAIYDRVLTLSIKTKVAQERRATIRWLFQLRYHLSLEQAA